MLCHPACTCRQDHNNCGALDPPGPALFLPWPPVGGGSEPCCRGQPVGGAGGCWGACSEGGAAGQGEVWCCAVLCAGLGCAVLGLGSLGCCAVLCCGSEASMVMTTELAGDLQTILCHDGCAT